MRSGWLGCALFVVLTVPVSGQTCPEGTISEITFERRKPFGPEATGPESRLGRLYRGLNAVHVRSLPTVLRWELLFREGDCLDDPRLLSESERALRSLPYIVEATVVSERLDDGTHRVDVRTIDSWALTFGLAFTADNGFQITGVSGGAKNLFGTGTRVGAFRNVWRERRRVGVLVRQPNLFGTRLDATAHGGSTRAGHYFEQSLLRPYAGEVGANAFRQAVDVREDVFLYSVDPALGFTQAYLRFEARTYELTVQRRLGDAEGARLIAGVGFTHEELRVPAGADDVQVVVGDDFDAPVAAPPLVVDEVSPQTREHAANRVSLTLGVRDVAFRNYDRLDALNASQDVPSGVDLTVTVAPGLSTGGDDFDDLYLRVVGLAGIPAGRSYLHARVDLQGRRVGSDVTVGPTGWRDLALELEADAYWTQTDRAQLFGRVHMAAASRMDRPFQLTLGGREAVRGYVEDAFPGARRLLLTVEQRLDLPALSTPIVDLGLVAFADAGRGWAGDAPFGETTGWKAGVGAGIRAGIPAGSSGVLRLDLGRPLTGDRATKGTTFRLYVELLGILDRRAWPTQMGRSRWYGVNPDLATRPVNPLATR